MVAANTAEVVQLTIGAVLGVAVSFNLDRFRGGRLIDEAAAAAVAH